MSLGFDQQLYAQFKHTSKHLVNNCTLFKYRKSSSLILQENDQNSQYSKEIPFYTVLLKIMEWL